MTGFKSPLSAQTQDLLFQKLDEAFQYLSALCLRSSGDRVVLCSKRTGVLGLMVDILSVKGLYVKYLAPRASFFCTYRLCQDLIELLFNCIRR